MSTSGSSAAGHHPDGKDPQRKHAADGHAADGHAADADEIDDPGRDPVGLHPTRDWLDAAGGPDTTGEFTPGRTSPGERQARSEPDEPPTSTSGGGP